LSFRSSLRLGPELAAQVEAFKAETNITTTSAAVRALLQLGLERSAALDATWRRVAWQEATISGLAKLKEAFTRAYHDVIEAGPQGPQ
jgi:hypothetical protein